MKNYSIKFLLLLSSTLLINQIYAGKHAKQKHSYRTETYNTTRNKKEIARKILRQNYLMHLNK